MTDIANRDPKGTIPAFQAARELLGAVSPRFRITALFAVVRRLLELADSEYAKASASGVTAEALTAATARAEKAEERLERVLGVMAEVKSGRSSASAADPAPVATTRRRTATDAQSGARTLSPTRAVPKTGSRGRPKGAKNKPKAPAYISTHQAEPVGVHALGDDEGGNGADYSHHPVTHIPDPS